MAAIVLALIIWSGHRSDADERRYQTEVLKAAADWTTVLVNMNKDDIDASLQKLHDGTVGELNNEFESALEPYKKVVQTLQSRTKGQIDSVAIESIYHRPQTLPDGRPAPAPTPQPALAELVKRTDTVMVVATSISENVGGKPQTRALEHPAGRLRRRRQAADLPPGAGPVRNRLRVLAFDVAAPLAAIAALIYIGIAMAWPLWWVSLASVLCLLIVEGVIVNAVLARRDGVTVGTDDDGPGLRLAVVGMATVALVAAVVVGYTQWTVPDRNLRNDSAEVVGIASSVAEASATFTPSSPTAAIDRATELMTPERAEKYKNEFAAVAKQLTSKKVTASASTISAGVEAIGPQRRQRRGDHARYAERAGSAARHRGAGPANHIVEGRRPLARRRRDADQLALSKRACSTFRQRSITTCRPAASPSRATCSSHRPDCNHRVFAPTSIASSSTSGRCSRRRKTSTRSGTTGSAARFGYVGVPSISLMVGLTR